MNIIPAQKPIKAWTDGVPVEPEAMQQLRNMASMPFVPESGIAVMPDVHLGIGATVGSVIPTVKAIIPAAVGVDIGCGMCAVRLEGLRSSDLPDSLSKLRADIEAAVPAGFARHGVTNRRTAEMNDTASDMISRFKWAKDKHAKAFERRKDKIEEIIQSQFGTLGGGNHFIELCLDEADEVWVMLHSGSRGIGNAIGQYFITLAKEDMERQGIKLPDRDLAYLTEETENFDDYIRAVHWAQEYARENRDAMLNLVLDVLREHLRPFRITGAAVNCHHNYVQLEHHFGQDVWLTRKGAISARNGQLGIIPGSMGARSYIVRGKGNSESYHSCSHGAGRVMSRGTAKKSFSTSDLEAQTAGVECRKDAGVIDEIPGAYKSIDAVMAAQTDLVEIVHTLKQVLCVKG